jgi:hypothetical protein
VRDQARAPTGEQRRQVSRLEPHDRRAAVLVGKSEHAWQPPMRPAGQLGCAARRLSRCPLLTAPRQQGGLLAVPRRVGGPGLEVDRAETRRSQDGCSGGGLGDRSREPPVRRAL